MLVDEVVTSLIGGSAFPITPFNKTSVRMLALFSSHGREDIMAVLEMDIEKVLGGKVSRALGTSVCV